MRRRWRRSPRTKTSRWAWMLALNPLQQSNPRIKKNKSTESDLKHLKKSRLSLMRWFLLRHRKNPASSRRLVALKNLTKSRFNRRRCPKRRHNKVRLKQQMPPQLTRHSKRLPPTVRSKSLESVNLKLRIRKKSQWRRLRLGVPPRKLQKTLQRKRLLPKNSARTTNSTLLFKNQRRLISARLCRNPPTRRVAMPVMVAKYYSRKRSPLRSTRRKTCFKMPWWRSIILANCQRLPMALKRLQRLSTAIFFKYSKRRRHKKAVNLEILRDQ